MEQDTSVSPKKHLKSFWPLMIIFVIAVILGGLIYWFQFNLKTDYDLQSMVVSVHRRARSDTKMDKKPVQSSQQGTPSATGTMAK